MSIDVGFSEFPPLKLTEWVFKVVLVCAMETKEKGEFTRHYGPGFNEPLRVTPLGRSVGPDALKTHLIFDTLLLSLGLKCLKTSRSSEANSPLSCWPSSFPNLQARQHLGGGHGLGPEKVFPRICLSKFLAKSG